MEESLSFEEYLLKKNIDAKHLKEKEPEIWHQWEELYNQVHPNSFEMQKKFQINEVRRKFQRDK